MLAARAASARPAVSASNTCSGEPAPPLATTGLRTASADAAANRERHEDFFRDAAHHVEHDGPAFVTCTDVEEDQLVRAFFLVPPGNFDRVARVAQVQEVGPLDDPAPVDIQTGYDAFGEH